MKILNILKEKLSETIVPTNLSFDQMIPNKTYYISKTRLNTDNTENVYLQESEKISTLIKSMDEDGYDNTQIIITDKKGHILDGLSRAKAALASPNVSIVPVCVKAFNTEAEKKLYQYKIQLSRRNLTSSQKFASFIEKEKLKHSNKFEHITDEEMSKELQTSIRNVQKMREIITKTPEKIPLIIKGEKSLNQIYNDLKNTEKPNLKISSKKICTSSFILGVKFAILEFAKGKSGAQILNNKVMKSNSITYSLSDDDFILLDKICNESKERKHGEEKK